ncbi:hypothetical protein ASPCAL04150 [Aspergillus calidoustus]|uniref:Putative zinc-finger domain-containing protein n=1 Tax=Aspergillus calidoustus TaxID=454130 RepID=A0A0U5FXG2_ASPCI|nr:hypothetical protein ASPCAL04150 [Aspergillus calidoustus]
MSNNPIPPPLPYWGPLNYTQQWGSHPPPSGTAPHNMQYNPNTTSAPQAPQNLESFYANANLPGFGVPGVNGSLPPPFPFPGAFPPAPGPPHFPALPNMSYPLMPLPPGPPNIPPAGPSTNDFIHSAQMNPANSHPMATLSMEQELDREEGELTDVEAPSAGKQQPFSRSTKRHNLGDSAGGRKSHDVRKARNSNKLSGQAQFKTPKGLGAKTPPKPALAGRRHRDSSSSDLEEGEASPEPPHSSRDSGSPYNPPMPLDPGSPFASKSLRESSRPLSPNVDAMDICLPNSTGTQASPGSGKSQVPLRVQAQGALLSLAPHNIRYNELISEGIDPVILRQLYEDIGIKVPTTPSTDLSSVTSSHENEISSTGPVAEDRQAKQLPQQLGPQTNGAQVPSTLAGPTSAQTQPVQANTAKPMERKEVIARMLAAKKAAKNSPTSAPPQGDPASTPPSLPTTAEASTVSTPLQELSSKDRELRVKEKNKAQTELARQRIEQLKKQGLMRSQQKTQSDNQGPEKEQGDFMQEPSHPTSSTIVKHPLPERPPVPDTASSDRIPGLFMTEQALEVTNGSDTTPMQDDMLDSVTQSRASQRKRPRASDFDEPIPLPKRAYSNGATYTPPERLVIDISDDEFYGDDEDVVMHSETLPGDSVKIAIAPTADSSYPPPIDNLPHRPATSQSHSISTSSTPLNSRNHEQEDLRKKDLEIQAMHRRIAELEQRKKARLASRTQSPRNSDVSPPEPVSMPVAALPDSNNDNVESFLAPLDVENLRRMKANILRVQEIEAGVPSLDAEIQKSEARLKVFKREEEKLLSELERGKEGRRQLLEELSNLKSELNGLSLDQVNTALSRLETQEEVPVGVVQAPGYGEKESSDENAVASSEVTGVDMQVQEDTASSQNAEPTTQEPELAEPSLNVTENLGDTALADAPEDQQSDTSMSEDSSSAMDESSDDSSSSPGSVNEEMPDAHDPVIDPVPALQENSTTPPEIPQNVDVEDQPSHELPPTNIPHTSDIVTDSGERPAAETVDHRASRESSVSEAYEPPEPEESTSSTGSDSSYSPAPSPHPLDPTMNMDISGPSEDPPQEAGEPLTGKVQELDVQQPSQYSQIGILDNIRSPEDTKHGFSPYVSLLRLFKSYRFHPNYSDNVSDGYRSLTYSHNIDPLKCLCPFESSGGVCNDRSCEFQHFRDMTLSDDKILVQMGSLREGKTPEECDKYIAGLKETINDMRRDKVKEFNTVAAEIAAYRRRFLQDPTRILAL